MIRSEEIDSTIQAAIRERYTQIFAPNAVLDPTTARVKAEGTKVWRQHVKRQSPRFWGAGAVLLFSWLSLPLLAPTNEGLGVLAFLSLSAAAVGIVVGTFQRVQKDLGRHVNSDVMRSASQWVALSRAEQLYCQAVAALVDVGATVSPEIQRDLLAQLNELLSSYRKLNTLLLRFSATSASDSISALQSELGALVEKRDAQSDPIARATMGQTIELCRGRLESAQRMRPAREQAEAQQELIVQTLGSIQASLARITGASVPSSSVDVSDLQRMVHEANLRARSVDEAVAEVLTLQG